jgi:peptidyl-prolyl cis-trans isomerase SurA
MISQKETPIQIRRQILKEMVKNELIYHAVREEFPRIPPATLFSLVEREIERLERQHGDLESVLKKEGLSLEGLRRKLKRDVERDNTINLAIYRYVESRVQVTDKDLERYRQGEEYRGFLDNQRIQVRQLALRVPEDATPEQVRQVKERIDNLALRVRAQPDRFLEMIRETSEHRGTRENEGLLGYRRGELGHEFDAAFDAEPGTFLPPFRSHFGYHLIRVERQSQTLRQYLMQRERQRILDEWLGQLWLRAKPYVKIKGEWADFDIP